MHHKGWAALTDKSAAVGGFYSAHGGIKQAANLFKAMVVVPSSNEEATLLVDVMVITTVQSLRLAFGSCLHEIGSDGVLGWESPVVWSRVLGFKPLLHFLVEPF